MLCQAPAAEGVRRSDLGGAAAAAAAPALDVPALAADANGRFGRGPATAVAGGREVAVDRLRDNFEQVTTNLRAVFVSATVPIGNLELDSLEINLEGPRTGTLHSWEQRQVSQALPESHANFLSET